MRPGFIPENQSTIIEEAASNEEDVDGHTHNVEDGTSPPVEMSTTRNRTEGGIIGVAGSGQLTNRSDQQPKSGGRSVEVVSQNGPAFEQPATHSAGGGSLKHDEGSVQNVHEGIKQEMIEK